MIETAYTDSGGATAPDRGLNPELFRKLLAELSLEVRLSTALVHEIGLSREESAQVLEVTPEALDRLKRQGLQALCLLLARRGWERLPHEVASALERLPEPPVPEGLVRRVQAIAAGEAARVGAEIFRAAKTKEHEEKTGKGEG